MEHKILSCIPPQLQKTQTKLEWLASTCTQNNIHILVTPQEFFGGAVMMPHKRDFTLDELFPKLSKIAKETKTALVIGVQQKESTFVNRSAIWFINEMGIFQGNIYKFALPRYDHINTNGFGNVTPEDNIKHRFKTFKLYNLNVSAIFCWEVYSDVLWTGLSILKPDVVFSMIKFGVNAWPKINTIKKLKTVVGFGYGRWSNKDDGGWIERLHVANKWQVKCPIINSTNSWNLNPRSMPICGTISNLDGQAVTDYWYPQKQDKLKKIPEKIIISTIDEQRVRGVLKNKFAYANAVGVFPPFSIEKYTMHLKINRIEDRLLQKIQRKNKKHIKDTQTIFNL